MSTSSSDRPGTSGIKKTCLLYGIQGFPHFRELDCIQTYVYTFGTSQSVYNIIDGCLQGQGSTVYSSIPTCLLAQLCLDMRLETI